MAYRLEFEQWLPFPPEKVFQFLADPRNLPQSEPAENDVRVLGAKLVARGEGEPDLKILVSFRPMPSLPFIRLRWVLLITDFEFGKSFRDIQIAGAFKSWEHLHEFAPASREGREGTLMRDLVQYELAVPLVSTLLNELFVRPRLKRIFAARQKNLEELLAEREAA